MAYVKNITDICHLKKRKKVLSAVLCLTDQLGHGPHGAVNAPASGLEKDHGHQAKDGGGQHHAVKAKGKLGRSSMEPGPMIRPVPGDLKGPQERHRLREICLLYTSPSPRD